jgi:2-polyprenyl-6-methoxyphenol hydroxylase-like FAD-dependent oxidoreductase
VAPSVGQLRRQTHPLGESLRFLDKTGTVFIDHAPPGAEGGRPEVDRTVLRDMLLASLDQDRITWGRKVTAVTAGELTLADGARVTADVIIGADGTWSRVRPLLSTAQPHRTAVGRCPPVRPGECLLASEVIPTLRETSGAERGPSKTRVRP